MQRSYRRKFTDVLIVLVSAVFVVLAGLYGNLVRFSPPDVSVVDPDTVTSSSSSDSTSSESPDKTIEIARQTNYATKLEFRNQLNQILEQQDGNTLTAFYSKEISEPFGADSLMTGNFIEETHYIQLIDSAAELPLQSLQLDKDSVEQLAEKTIASGSDVKVTYNGNPDANVNFQVTEVSVADEVNADEIGQIEVGTDEVVEIGAPETGDIDEVSGIEFDTDATGRFQVGGKFIGTTKVALIHLRYAGSPVRFDPQAIKTEINQGPLKSMRQESDGKFQITADAHGWYNIPIAGNCNISPDGHFYNFQEYHGGSINYSKYDFFVFIVDDSVNCTYGGRAYLDYSLLYNTANNRILRKYVSNFRADMAVNMENFKLVVGHELGHNLGSEHDNSYFCGAGVQTGAPRDAIDNSGVCRSYEYGDYHSWLGAGYGGPSFQFPFLNRNQYGWLSTNRLIIRGKDGEYGRFRISSRNNNYKEGIAFRGAGSGGSNWKQEGYYIEETRVTDALAEPELIIRFNPPEDAWPLYLDSSMYYQGQAIFKLPIAGLNFPHARQRFIPGDYVYDNYYNKLITYEQRTDNYSKVEVIDARVINFRITEGNYILNNNRPTLTWQYNLAKNLSANFEIEIATNPTFTNVIQRKVLRANSYKLQALEYGATYYARIRVNREGAPYATTIPFEVYLQPKKPVLRLPVNDARIDTVSNVQLLTWKDAADSNAVWYDIQVATDSNFNNVVLNRRIVRTPAGGTDYTLNATLTDIGDRYWWKVRGVSNVPVPNYVTGKWSNKFNFYLGQQIAKPVQVSPANNAVIDPPNSVAVKWKSGKTSAQRFRIELSATADFATVSRTFFVAADAANVDEAVTYTHVLPAYTVTAATHWRVRGERLTGVASDWSTKRKFYPPSNSPTEPLWRFYQSRTLGHLYTNRVAERNKLRDQLPFRNIYTYEGEKNQVLPRVLPTPDPTAKKVYRAFNKQSKTHRYTINTNLYNSMNNNTAQWQGEGYKFHAHGNGGGGRVPFHEFYNTITGGYFYTSRQSERQSVQNNLPQFQYKGISFYVYPKS